MKRKEKYSKFHAAFENQPSKSQKLWQIYPDFSILNYYLIIIFIDMHYWKRGLHVLVPSSHASREIDAAKEQNQN